MATTRETKPAQFRKFMDSLAEGAVLLPHLEAALATDGKRSWPEELPIKVSNKEHLFDGYFHPSDAAAMPALLLYYMFHPEYRERLILQRETGIQVMTLMVGSAMHAVIQSLLVELGLATPDQIEVTYRDDFRRSSGTLDVRRLELPGEDVRPMCEIKTIARLPRAPLPQHILQMQPYMDLGAEYREYGVLLYVEKPWPHGFKEFRVERDERLLESMYTKWRMVREAIELSDPSMLSNCTGCELNNTTHANCPARMTCRIGPPQTTVRRKKR